jgi:hypothetical protein
LLQPRGGREREQSEERKQGGKRRRKLREMEINKSEANKERVKASKKEICFAYTHAWTRVERERERESCMQCTFLLPPLLMTTASISKVAIKTEVEGVGTLFGSEFVRKGDKS